MGTYLYTPPSVPQFRRGNAPCAVTRCSPDYCLSTRLCSSLLSFPYTFARGTMKIRVSRNFRPRRGQPRPAFFEVVLAGVVLSRINSTPLLPNAIHLIVTRALRLPRAAYFALNSCHFVKFLSPLYFFLTKRSKSVDAFIGLYALGTEFFYFREG